MTTHLPSEGADASFWEVLLARIAAGNCTPFLGAGAGVGTLPLGHEIAARWADRYGYPLEDPHDLPRVAQFVGVHYGDAMIPKEHLRSELASLGPPDFRAPGEPHGVLAEMPLPIYVTTNYDNFMVEALRDRGKDPRRDICRWNMSPAVRSAPAALDSAFAPTTANPLVYSLHGHFDIPESLVLTEDDYLDFLVAIARYPDLLPHQIQKALAGATLLFIGYSLADWDFRVLHRGLVMASEPSLRRLSVAVQLRPSDAALTYLDKYFGLMNVRVYWGTASEFVTDLQERWTQYEHGK
jgi:SIR2-like domain